MPSKKKKPESLNDLILRMLRTKKPKTVEELVKLVQDKSPASRETIADHISQLRDEGKIELEEPIPPPTDFPQYLRSPWSKWLWYVVGILVATVLSSLLIPVEAGWFIVVRYILGFIFILFIPGYCFVEALFPKKGELDEIERFSLSIGLSLAISPLTALILNFTPWGIRTIPVFISLSLVTLALGLFAAWRKFLISKGRDVWPFHEKPKRS